MLFVILKEGIHVFVAFSSKSLTQSPHNRSSSLTDDGIPIPNIDSKFSDENLSIPFNSFLHLKQATIQFLYYL